MQGKYDYDGKLPSYIDCWNRLEQKNITLSQQDFAKLVGISQSYVSKLKKKDIFLPEWAYVVSKKYDISMDWILNGIHYKPDDEKTELDHFLEELKGWLLTLENDPDKRKWFTLKFGQTFPDFHEWLMDQLNERMNVDHIKGEGHF